MLDALRGRGVATTGCLVDASVPTGFSVILSQPADRAILTYPGSIARLRLRDIDPNILRRARHLHVGGYFLLDALRPDLSELFGRAKAQGLSTSLDTNWDPSGRWNVDPEKLWPVCDVFLPNEAEACHIARTETLGAALDVLSTQLPTLAVKTGVRGGIARQGSQTVSAAPLEHRTVTLPQFVKRTPPGLLLFLGQATGITSPWTLEAHIDGALPSAYALATALHEMTHLCGYGSEAETDFVAGIAGLTATDRYTRYSVALVLSARVARNLPPNAYRVRFAALPEQAKDDLRAFSDAYTRFRPPQIAAYVQTKLYDSYLKTQGVGVGVADYDRVVDLLVAARRSGLLSFDGQSFTVKP